MAALMPCLQRLGITAMTPLLLGLVSGEQRSDWGFLDGTPGETAVLGGSMIWDGVTPSET